MFCRGCKKALFSTAAGPWAGRRCFWGEGCLFGPHFLWPPGKCAKGRPLGFLLPAPPAGAPCKTEMPRPGPKRPRAGRRCILRQKGGPAKEPRRPGGQLHNFRPSGRARGRHLRAAGRHSCKFCPVSQPKFYAGRKLNLRPRRGKIINSAPAAPAFGGRNPAPAAFGPR